MKFELQKMALGQSLDEEEMFTVVEEMMHSEPEIVSEAQIGAFLFALAARLPTSDELVGAARALRQHMQRIEAGSDSLIDTAGTGGSGQNTFNTSTVSALVLAAGGLKIAKHGNRAATSACGSADVLEALGVKISLPPEASLRCLQRTGFCFLFAPQHHAATKRVQGIRKQFGFRTIFNFLGPLVNPASARTQLVGVSEAKIQASYAAALVRLGAKRAMVVCGADGLDEISLTAETFVYEVRENDIRSYSVTPEQFGLKRASLQDISGAAPEQAAKDVRAILSGDTGPKHSLVCLNAGAGFYIAGVDNSIEEGIRRAREVLASGAVLRKLEAIIAETNA